MNTKLQTALTAYAAFLKAGTSYGTAMQALAKSLGGTPCATTLAEFAKLHAEKYKCNFTWDGKGRAVFFDGDESTRKSRNNAARMSWQRNVMVWFTPEKPTAPQAPTASARVSKAHRDLAMDFLSHFEGKDLAEQIRKAKALLNAL
jgi:hypothetical protein